MTEPLVQVTDRFGRVVGLAAMFEAFERQLIRRTVYVMLVDNNGRFLLQKRSVNPPNYPGYWDASAGGHVDEGEEPETAAYRELEEELGVVGVALRFVASFYFESDGDGRTYKYYAHIYSGEAPSGNLFNRVNDEVDDVGFYTSAELSALGRVTPITKHIIGLL